MAGERGWNGAPENGGERERTGENGRSGSGERGRAGEKRGERRKWGSVDGCNRLSGASCDIDTT